MSSTRVGVVIVNWNGKSDTIACLRSLSAVTDTDLYPIVIDNGSSDGSIEALTLLKSEQNFELIEIGKNIGFAAGCNVGIRYALSHDFSHICLLNSDTTIDPHLFSRLTAASHEKNERAIFGGELIDASSPEYTDHFGGIWNPRLLAFDLIGIREKKGALRKMLPLDYVCGCLLFASKSIFETVGFLHEPFFLYWEESDFCMRAKKMGIISYVCPGAYVFHKGALFSGKTGPFHEYYYHRNRLLFIRRNISLNIVEKKQLRKQLLKLCRHWLLTGLQAIMRPTKKKSSFMRKHAQLTGVAHYFAGRLGKR